MAYKIVHIRKNGSGLLGTGITINVTDSITGEELYKNSIWPANGPDSKTYYGIAISYWGKLKTRFGDDIKLDNTRFPELTEEFLNAGQFPKKHVARVEEKYKDNYWLYIYIDGFTSLPVYEAIYNVSWLNDLPTIAGKIKLAMKRYCNTSIDLSKASLLKRYF
jgi:hypothetical protein